jgi:hypothetical protein
MSVSQRYDQYLRSEEWQQKRSQRLKIDGYKCQRCGKPYDLQIHHLTYDRVYDEDVYNDLITLCDKCHGEVEREKAEYKMLEQMKSASWYKDRYYKERQMDLLFCRVYEDKDLSSGGNLNLTNLDVIRKEYAEWSFFAIGEELQPVTIGIIQRHFRDKRIRLVLKLSEHDAPPEVIMSKGISPMMVRKYYKNRQLALTVMKGNEETEAMIYGISIPAGWDNH